MTSICREPLFVQVSVAALYHWNYRNPPPSPFNPLITENTCRVLCGVVGIRLGGVESHLGVGDKGPVEATGDGRLVHGHAYDYDLLATVSEGGDEVFHNLRCSGRGRGEDTGEASVGRREGRRKGGG